jgi:hypothetical protein
MLWQPRLAARKQLHSARSPPTSELQPLVLVVQAGPVHGRGAKGAPAPAASAPAVPLLLLVLLLVLLLLLVPAAATAAAAAPAAPAAAARGRGLGDKELLAVEHGAVERHGLLQALRGGQRACVRS